MVSTASTTLSTTRVSIIIPVWNGVADLSACLRSLQQQQHPIYEIIAVDNASSDGSADLIARDFPQVRLIRNSTNLGFGGACNIGLAAATGDLLVLLNQDTEVREGWLAALVAAFADSSIGIAGCKALYPDGTLQHAGGWVDAQGGGHHLGYREADAADFDQLRDVDYVTGASLALRRTVYARTGGFDPAFNPAYCEDVDLCYQARALGWRVVYVPQSVLIHKERSHAAAPDHAGMLLYQRNRLRFVAKHWEAARLRQEFLPAEQGWLESLGQGAEGLVAAAHHAYLLQLLNLAELAAWRQQHLGEAPATIDTLAQVLLTLRACYPLSVVGDARLGHTAELPAMATLLPLAEIRAEPFRSQVPLIGPLIAAFRHQWNRVSTEWYVKPMLRQQSHFNATVISALAQTLERRQSDQYLQARLGAVLAEYISGQAREISALSQEVAALKQQMAALNNHNQDHRSEGSKLPERLDDKL